MDENFKKIKKKFLIYSVIKSLICAVSAGLFAVGVILLSLKLAGVPIHFGYYLLIGVCVAGGCFGAVFPFLRPDDLAVARKLDREYALRERVETMVAYEKDGGDMALLQREDAQLKLGNLPKLKPDFKKLWQYIVIPFIAVAVFVAALVIPDNYPEGEKVEIHKLTDWQLDSIKEIIANVQDSDINDEAKEKTVAALDGFYNAGVLGIPEYAFKALIETTIHTIDEAIVGEQTYYSICKQLVTSELYQDLAFTVYNGANAFQGVVKYSSYDTARARAATLEADIDYICRTYILDGEESLLNHFKAISQEDGLMYYLKEYKDGLNELLQKSGVATTDGVYRAFASFVSDIETVTALEGRSDAYIYNLLQSGAFKSLADSMPFYLYLQSYNYLMDEYIREKFASVCEYSGVLDSVIEELKIPAGEDEPPVEDDPNEGGNNGGLGNGDMVYGSDDIIYDPDKGYVSYGEVINDYYSRVLGQIIEGSIPEDIASILTNYFDMLISGIEQNDDDKNN
ncbi:MAG: hypothetical protein K2H30_02960 [Clostridia bacterium]|nr:hypothetical protein [Clostridia bacterium]